VLASKQLLPHCLLPAQQQPLEQALAQQVELAQALVLKLVLVLVLAQQP
jgi:hypothetical protein